MGTFRVDYSIENLLRRTKSVTVSGTLVDTGSEYTWVPARLLEQIGIKREKKDVAMVMANGKQITRNVGFAIVRIGKEFTVDEVVFAEPGDQSLLGARSLEGLRLRVDRKYKKLIAAGPYRAASSLVIEERICPEAAILARPSLAEGWVGTEVDEAWKHLSDLPAV